MAVPMWTRWHSENPHRPSRLARRRSPSAGILVVLVAGLFAQRPPGVLPMPGESGASLHASPALQSRLGERTSTVLRILGQHHYRPLSLDESAGAAVRSDFLFRLDSGGLFFLEEDERSLAALPLSLQQVRPGQPIPFFEMSVSRFRQRLGEVLQLLDAMEKRPIEWNADSVEFIPRDEVRFTKTAAERSHRWSKLVRYHILSVAAFRRGAASLQTGTGDFEQGLARGEAELRSLVIRREKKRILDLLHHRDGFENFAASVFINTIVGRYDPHSLFLSAADRRNMEAMLSARAFSYGLAVGKAQGGEIRIDRLVPGGPAWKSSRVNPGDVVLEVIFPDEGNRSVDLADLSLEEASAAVNDTRSVRMVLVLRKPTGLVVRVPLVKEKLSVEENRVTGFILEGKRRIGYIYLPAFYTDVENREIATCANDVAKEIVKLKRENIDGLLLDLRGNGGGSVSEAVHLAGLFIDQGPIVVRSSGREKPVVMKDPSRGTVYDGPLVVMVNGQSASASEFFVTALRDHNRAILVGHRTYGKGSGQMIVPAVADRSQIQSALQSGGDGLDFLKVTTDVFYDLSGHTHQAIGVLPDVVLPDPFPDEPTGEKTSPNALHPPVLAKTIVYEKGRDLPRADLARKSSRRHDEFEELMNLSGPLRRAVIPGKVSLRPMEFFAGMRERVQTFEAFEAAMGSKRGVFQVRSTSYGAELDRVDSYHRDGSNRLIDQLSRDPYLNEGFRVAVDLVNALD